MNDSQRLNPKRFVVEFSENQHGVQQTYIFSEDGEQLFGILPRPPLHDEFLAAVEFDLKWMQNPNDCLDGKACHECTGE